MDMLSKFRMGAKKVGIQATAFMKDSSGKVASGSRDFAHTFSLPGEAEKAARILDSFLGASGTRSAYNQAYLTSLCGLTTQPTQPARSQH
jgi:hypothetical protein